LLPEPFGDDGAWPSAFRNSSTNSIDLIGLQAAQLVFYVVAQVPAVIQDGLRQVAELLGVSTDTVRRWADARRTS
jgi:hypothetical protein